MIQDEIRTLLDAPPSGEKALSLDDIEHTLTAGYASALALEAERWRVERKIAEIAARLGDQSSNLPSELTTLRQRPSLPDGDLTNPRGVLSSFRSRADGVTTAASR